MAPGKNVRDKMMDQLNVLALPPLMGYGKPLGPKEKTPFPTLIFLIDTFAKLLTDSLVIAVHTNLLAIK